MITCFSDPVGLLFQNSAKKYKLVFMMGVASIWTVRMCSTLIVGIYWNSLIAPQRLSGELSSYADEGYPLLKFLMRFIFFLFPPPKTLFVASLSEKQVIDLVWPKLKVGSAVRTAKLAGTVQNCTKSSSC